MPIPPQEVISAGEKAKARDILAAVIALKTIEREHRIGTDAERALLARFGGFGALALSIFPDPVTGRYKDDSWRELGHQLRSLLTQEEYDSAKRTTFTRRVPIGSYRGMTFGMVLRPGFPPDPYLQGKATLSTIFAMQYPGPRAVMNALHHLAQEYVTEADSARQRIAIAEGQLRDYTARLGLPFPHERYLAELHALRDQLRLSLSATAQSSASPTTGELVDRIRSLQSSNRVEPPAPRDRTVQAEVEESIVTRIRKRRESAAPSPMPPAEDRDSFCDSNGSDESTPDASTTTPSFAGRVVASLPSSFDTGDSTPQRR